MDDWLVYTGYTNADALVTGAQIILVQAKPGISRRKDSLSDPSRHNHITVSTWWFRDRVLANQHRPRRKAAGAEDTHSKTPGRLMSRFSRRTACTQLNQRSFDRMEFSITATCAALRRVVTSRSVGLVGSGLSQNLEWPRHDGGGERLGHFGGVTGSTIGVEIWNGESGNREVGIVGRGSGCAVIL